MTETPRAILARARQTRERQLLRTPTALDGSTHTIYQEFYELDQQLWLLENYFYNGRHTDNDYINLSHGRFDLAGVFDELDLFEEEDFCDDAFFKIG